MKFFEKIKLTIKYYKSLGKNDEANGVKEKLPQKCEDIKLRPDVFAFLTCPQPVLESEKIAFDINNQEKKYG